MNQHNFKVIEKLKKDIIDKYPDASFIFYGSNATGAAEVDSDIDILVLLDRKIDSRIRQEIFNITYEIELNYDVVFGIVVESRKFWNSSIAKAMPFHWSVDKYGVQV